MTLRYATAHRLAQEFAGFLTYETAIAVRDELFEVLKQDDWHPAYVPSQALHVFLVKLMVELERNYGADK